jgi:D-3-phosphoglycerate dehydrogenase
MKLNLVRFDFFLNDIFDSKLSKDPLINLKICKQSDSDEINLDVFRSAHIYHILAARDEVPKQWHVTEDLLQDCRNLICVSTSGAGFDPVDVEACNRHGVLVVNQSGANADSVAEHALGLMLSVKHRISESDRYLREGTITTRENLMGHELRGLTLGIVGIGETGRRTAFLAKAFGMNVLAFDPNLSDSEIESRSATSCNFSQLIKQSDIVSVHCPRNIQTLNLFNHEVFTAMKSGAVFISTARGGIHNEDDLYSALVSGKLSGAGLDVWSIEPPNSKNPLLRMPQVVSTYHTAGVTHEARFNGANIAADQISLLAKGIKPPRMINPEVWPVVLEKLKIIGFN